MRSREGQQELLDIIELCVKNSSLQQEYSKILQISKQKGISLYETNLFIASQLNKRKRIIVNTEGIIKKESVTINTGGEEKEDLFTVNNAHKNNAIGKGEATKLAVLLDEQKKIDYYKRANKMLRKVISVLVTISALIGLLWLVGFDIPNGIRSILKGNSGQKLSFENLYELTRKFNKEHDIYHLYYFDVSASTKSVNTKLEEFTEKLSNDDDYHTWLEYAKDKDAKTKLGAWLMANPTSKYRDKNTSTPRFSAFYFAQEVKPLMVGSNFELPLNRENVESVLKNLNNVKLEQSFVDSTMFSAVMKDIKTRVRSINGNANSKKSKHVIITILSDFYLDDLSEQNVNRDIQDVPAIANAIDKLQKLNSTSVEFNLIRLEQNANNQRYYGNLDDRFIMTIQDNFYKTTVYDIDDIFLNLENGYTVEGVKEMFLSINTATIYLPDESRYQHHLQISKDGYMINTHIENPDFNYINFGRNEDRNKVVMKLSLYDDGLGKYDAIKYDEYNCISKKNVEGSSDRLPVNKMANKTFVPPNAMRFTGVVPSDSQKDFKLMIYHLGLDKKFIIPLRQK